jgi:hypothetical protein
MKMPQNSQSTLVYYVFWWLGRMRIWIKVATQWVVNKLQLIFTINARSSWIQICCAYPKMLFCIRIIWNNLFFVYHTNSLPFNRLNSFLICICSSGVNSLVSSIVSGYTCKIIRAWFVGKCFYLHFSYLSRSVALLCSV